MLPWSLISHGCDPERPKFLIHTICQKTDLPWVFRSSVSASILLLVLLLDIIRSGYIFQEIVSPPEAAQESVLPDRPGDRHLGLWDKQTGDDFSGTGRFCHQMYIVTSTMIYIYIHINIHIYIYILIYIYI